MGQLRRRTCETVSEPVRLGKRMLRKLKKYAVKCSEGDEYFCQKYNEVIDRVEPPFFVYRGVDSYGAKQDLRMGEIIAGKIRDAVTYFTLDPEYAEGYAGPEGIIYMVKVTRSTRKMFKFLKYSTKVKRIGITSMDDELHANILAREMACITEKFPLDPSHVIILYPVARTYPPKPFSDTVLELVEEYRKRGFKTYLFYYGNYQSKSKQRTCLSRSASFKYSSTPLIYGGLYGG